MLMLEMWIVKLPLLCGIAFILLYSVLPRVIGWFR